MHHSDCAGGRLQPAVLESGHLQIETLPLSFLAPDQVLGCHPPVVERELVGVHAAVAERVDRSPFELALTEPGRPALDRIVLGEQEAVRIGLRLRDDEEREAAMTPRPIRVGARKKHQNVGTGGERAPRLHPVHEVATTLGRRGGHRQVRNVRTEVRLGDGDGDHQLGTCDQGQQPFALFLGAAVHDCASEDLRSRDQCAAGAERRAGELFGRDDHAEVVVLPA